MSSEPTPQAPGADAYFSDALSGASGMADPPVTSPLSEVFPDPLVAPEGPIVSHVALPEIPVVDVKALVAEQLADWDEPAPEVRRRPPAPQPAPRAAVQPSPVQPSAPLHPGQQFPPQHVAQLHAPPQRFPPQQFPPQQFQPQQFPSHQSTQQFPSQQVTQRPAPPQQRPVAIQQPTRRPPAPTAGQSAATKKRKSGSGIGCLVFIVIILVSSGLGRQLLDAIAELFEK